MENRRNDYRHTFPLDDRLRVELSMGRGRRWLEGQIVDLSVSGMSVDLGDDCVPLRADQPCCVIFSIPHGLRRLALAAEVVHVSPQSSSRQLGLRFLPLDDLNHQEEQERALWIFLLNEQRRLRRQDRWRAMVLSLA